MALSGPEKTTGATFLPNLIVAFSSPTPRKRTNWPASPCRGEIELIRGHAMPDAIGRPKPDARSKPFVVLNAPLCERGRSLLPGVSIVELVQLMPRAMPMSRAG